MRFTFAPSSPEAVPIVTVSERTWDTLSESRRRRASAIGFEPKPGRHALLPAMGDEAAVVFFGLDDPDTAGADRFALGRLATLLPKGDYRLAPDVSEPGVAALSWALTSYRFSRYKKATPPEAPRLCAPADVDAARIERIAAAVAFGRDLINTPANDLGPEALTLAAEQLAGRYGAAFSQIIGADLETGFPLIHAVGQAGHEPPRLVELTWGAADAPAVTLVGKGVTFDTGGLNIKPDAGMLLMKKDMGGAAAALALAEMIMDAGLSLRLRVILPIVENAIASAAFRPGDVIRSRKGLTVEIGNTDAEGRLILADALTFASQDKPGLLFDFATLTGAARVALGPDLPPFFTENDELARELMVQGTSSCDPVWRLPLWLPYDTQLDGKVADISNVGGSGHAGSITAALFLRRFVEQRQSWVHFDIFGWSPVSKPGRPEGGEVQTARLLYDFLEARYPA